MPKECRIYTIHDAMYEWYNWVVPHKGTTPGGAETPTEGLTELHLHLGARRMPNHTVSPESPSQSPVQTEDRDPLNPHFTVLEFFSAVNEVGARVIINPDKPEELILLPPDPNAINDATDKALEVLRAELDRLDRTGGKEFILAMLHAYLWFDRVRVDLLRAMPYADYLKSHHWNLKRRAALERAEFTCQVCNSPEKIQVHHRTYSRRGDEPPEDLTVLCATCHQLFHDHGRLTK